MSKEFIFELDNALYNEETGEAVFKPKVKGELIRCGECESWDTENSSGRKSLKNYRCACLEWSNLEDGYYVYTAEDEYCSRAERKEKTDV